MKIGKALLVVISLLVSVNAHAEYRYLDRVRIVEGFYRGRIGILQEKARDRYRVKLVKAGKIVTVSEDEIELTTARIEDWKFN